MRLLNYTERFLICQGGTNLVIGSTWFVTTCVELKNICLNTDLGKEVYARGEQSLMVDLAPIYVIEFGQGTPEEGFKLFKAWAKERCVDDWQINVPTSWDKN